MKTRSSIKAFKNRKGCIVVARKRSNKRRLFVVNKQNPKLNVKQ